MLERLVIRNLAVIEHLDLEIGPGLTVLTGETGAGKSIIVDALNLLVGGRATTDLLRSGEDRAFVQGVFTVSNERAIELLHELELYDESGLIITREITSTRSSCRVNGKIVTQSSLKEIGAFLVDMHGQHEHQSLLQPDQHRQLVDSYIGEPARELLKDLASLGKAFNSCTKEIAELSGDEMERSRLIDLFTYQIQEIDNARLKSDEEEELKNERSKLLNFEKLQGIIERAYGDLYAGQGRNKAVIDTIGRISSDLVDASRIAPELSPIKELLEQASYLIDDAAREIAAFKDQLSFEPDRLQHIETRLDLISKLKRKYGESTEQILAFRTQAALSLERIASSHERVAELLAERERIEKQYRMATQKLRSLRLSKGEELVQRAMQHVRDLGMGNARLSLELRETALDSLSPHGSERIELLFSANVGEELKPLSKIASGGEMSRVMLGLKAVFSQLDDIATLVFDEIDSGVGGKAAQAVAEKIAAVAQEKQVLCVTHLPQIAAAANNHLYILKQVNEERTVTTVALLDKQARVRELARMLSGNESNVAMKHAQELLEKHQASA